MLLPPMFVGVYTVSPVSSLVVGTGDSLEYCASFFFLVGCRSASLSEENCSLFLCAAAMFCVHLHLTAPYCPLLPHVTLFSPMRHRTAHLSPVPSRSLEIHAGEEKGGNGGGGATRARSWASGESCVGGSGGERADGSEEHGGVFLGWFPSTAHHASLASTRYNFRRAALVERRRTDAYMPGHLRCGERD